MFSKETGFIPFVSPCTQAVCAMCAILQTSLPAIRYLCDSRMDSPFASLAKPITKSDMFEQAAHEETEGNTFFSLAQCNCFALRNKF